MNFTRNAMVAAVADAVAPSALPTRAADSIGLAFGALRTGADFRRNSPTLDSDGDGIPDVGYHASGWEKDVELYYRYKLNSHVELPPDLQWIRQPGGNASASAVTVVGLRAKMGF